MKVTRIDIIGAVIITVVLTFWAVGSFLVFLYDNGAI